MMDVVYFIKADPENDSEELRYSLRSLSNMPHGEVYIVGEKPDWVTNVKYLPIPQAGAKNENVSKSLRAVLDHDAISDEFILMNDDFFITKNIDYLPRLNFGELQSVIRAYEARYPDSTNYIDNMKSVYELLVSSGFERPLSYELHVPMTISRSEARNLFKKSAGQRVYQFRSYYGNHMHIGGDTIQDVKIFLNPDHNPIGYNEDPESYLQSMTFISSTGGAFKRGLVGDFIRASLPAKCAYEKY